MQHTQAESAGKEEAFYTNRNQERTEVAKLTSDKIEFK